MNVRRLVFLAVFSVLFSFIAVSQNPPQFEVPAKDYVVVNSGKDFILMSEVNDGDTGGQELDFEVISSDETILTVDSVSWSSGDKMAVIWVSEQRVKGTVILTAKVSDADGLTSKDFEVQVSEYRHHGIKFEIHDAIFWQEVIPLDDTPIFNKTVQSTNMTAAYNSLNWNEIPLTVSAGCNNPDLCDGHDFSTGFLEGYLVPKKSGNYSFYMNGDGDYALFLSTTKSYDNAKTIIAKSNNHGNVGTSSSYGRKSAPVPLDSGKVYGIYAAQWNVHHETGGIKWELPGEFDAEFIDGKYLYPEYDISRPAIVKDITVLSTGDRFAQIAWSASSDNQKLKGYNVYLNGVKINATAVGKTRFLLENLTAGTNYSFTVTAVDLVDNESYINEIVNFETLPPDTVAPTPPTTLSVDQATGLAVTVTWEGAEDEQSPIFGYNIYINGELYNADSIINDNSAVLKVLQPESEYTVEIEAVDAGLNVSEKSEAFIVSTVEFDPMGDNLGIQTGKLDLSTTVYSFNEGLGVNPNYKSGDVFNSAHTTLFADLKPGAIRWGALTANPLSFSDYAGANKEVTIGRFMERCNEFGAYTTFCCGVENSTDWRQDPETFIRFLEYINGPDDTPGGQLRVAEGYTEPFLKNSPGLIFEFGNEVWGGNSHNAQIGKDYVKYAEWCREIAKKMKASPYYDSTKIFLAYSARYPSREKSYGLNDKIIKGDQGEVEWLAPSGYLGGNLNYDPELPPAYSELEYYQNIRNKADEYLTGMVGSHKYEVQQTGRLKEQYMYESNTTTSTYNGRLGQAILSMDYYLTAMERGSAIPTIFHLTGGQWRITEPENNYRRLPLFLTARYFNHLCKGDVLANTFHSPVAGTSETGAAFAERPVGAHFYKNDSGYTVVLLSRDYVDDHYVQVTFPDELQPAATGQLYSITGSDFNTKNAVVDTTEVAVENNMVVKVPKHGMVLLHFDAEEITMENLPLAWYPYPRLEEIELTPATYNYIEPGKTVRFDVNLVPSNAWDRKVQWQLLNNSGNFNTLKSDSYCVVYSGSSLENETDSLVLQAVNRTGEVTGEAVIYLPGYTDAGDIQKRSSFRIYPNPANDKVRVEMAEEGILRIFSLSGTKVLEGKLQEGRHELSVGHLPQGVYTVQVGAESERLIVSD